MMDAEKRKRIAENWNLLRNEVREATLHAGIDEDSVTIIGVSKYVDAETTIPLVDAGCKDLGENRPQSLWDKAETPGLTDRVRWHAIGHLQRNKIRRTLRYRPIIHSVDSLRLLQSIAKESIDAGITTQVMVEVNISGDESKTGLNPEATAELLGQLPDDGVEVIGMMAMSGLGSDRDEARRHFSQARQLRDELTKQTGLELKELSMGMSADFQEAIAEGATMIRVGSRLFEGVM